MVTGTTQDLERALQQVEDQGGEVFAVTSAYALQTGVMWTVVWTEGPR
jgi:hypothetical protein